MNSHPYLVYVLQSERNPKEIYVGKTTDLDRRLKEHNGGKNPSSQHWRPWRVLTYTAFPTKALADAFELYLKTGSGRAFRSRHFQ